MFTTCVTPDNDYRFLSDTKNCKTCERVLGVLERVGEEVAGNGITLVRVNDKKAAKQTHAILCANETWCLMRLKVKTTSCKHQVLRPDSISSCR